MKHQQLLDKLAAKHLVQALDEDLARLVADAMMYRVPDIAGYVLTPMLDRWNCVLLASNDEISARYKQKAVLALATLLHKYGLAYPSITEQAVTAIDALNDAVALSDEFERRSPEFKKELRTDPKPLSRKPSRPNHLTFYRAQDVISIQLDGRYHAAYIHELARINECPVIEFYAGSFDQVPTIEELANVPAQGETYNDGCERISRASVSGIKYQPDPANQITLIAACVAETPDSSHLAEPVGLYSVEDIFGLQNRFIRRLFGDARAES